MTTEIALKEFLKDGSSEFYRAYRRLKYQVFVEELSWRELIDSSEAATTKEDPFDAAGRFLLAVDDGGLPIGVVRAIALKDGFPHRDLFEHHLHHPQFSAMLQSICMLNALAVLPAYRGKTFRTAEQNWEGSVARLLVLGIMRLMEEQNNKAAIATAQGAVVFFFQKLGFVVIDRPAVTHLHPDIFTNVGLVFGSSGHREALEACKMASSEPAAPAEQTLNLLKYFEECQQSALGPDTLESLIAKQ